MARLKSTRRACARARTDGGMRCQARGRQRQQRAAVRPGSEAWRRQVAPRKPSIKGAGNQTVHVRWSSCGMPPHAVSMQHFPAGGVAATHAHLLSLAHIRATRFCRSRTAARMPALVSQQHKPSSARGPSHALHLHLPRLHTAAQALNVLGTPLACCCLAPKTGFYRDGFCRTGGGDYGVHVVCAQVRAPPACRRAPPPCRRSRVLSSCVHAVPSP